MRYFTPLLAKKFKETLKCDSLFNNCQVVAKTMVLLLFHEMRQFLQLLAKELIKMLKHSSLFEKLQVLTKIDDL